VPVPSGNGLVFGWKGLGQIGDKEYEKYFEKTKLHSQQNYD